LHTTFPCKAIDLVFDTQICSTFLNQNFRTTVFYSNSKIVDLYPEHLKPCFVYLNVGREIVRLEFPIWITQKLEHLGLLCKIAIDQATKGQGYPVVLAEAHEQAVISGGDKNFFYQLLCKKSIEQHRQILMSPKNLKKRIVSI
jgi:NurA-like 5'-3' nuclease